MTKFGTAVLAALAASTVLLLSAGGHAQSFQVVHAFAGRTDGATPEAGLTIDRAGRLYGTTSGAVVPDDDGSVFKATASGSGWITSPLYDFLRQAGGIMPGSTLTIGPDGNLYGTSAYGGEGVCDEGNGCGTVFKLQPPPTFCASFFCPWHETVLYEFAGGTDGWLPGALTFDAAGNLYGVTYFGGFFSCGGDGCGTVFKLSPFGSGWAKTVLYNFAGADDGYAPVGGLIFDAAGNLYGTAYGGSGGKGVVYQLTPGSPYWTETALHSFQGPDGNAPAGPLIADSSGSLYGVTNSGGSANGGTVFRLAQPGAWNFESLYSFVNSPGLEPNGGLILDAAGNLYGTTGSGGAFNGGTAFKLVPSNGSWTAIDLHDFSNSDGLEPNGGPVFDANGNLYGTSIFGGNTSGDCSIGCGTVWQITP